MKLICELTESVDYELIEEGVRKKQYFMKVSLCSPTEKQERTNLSKEVLQKSQSLRQRVRRTKTSLW